jgi:hypothetical protein
MLLFFSRGLAPNKYRTGELRIGGDRCNLFPHNRDMYAYIPQYGDMFEPVCLPTIHSYIWLLAQQVLKAVLVAYIFLIFWFYSLRQAKRNYLYESCLWEFLHLFVLECFVRRMYLWWAMECTRPFSYICKSRVVRSSIQNVNVFNISRRTILPRRQCTVVRSSILSHLFQIMFRVSL